MSGEDLITETRIYPGEVRPKPFTFGSLFMGVLPFVSLGPEGRCKFQVDHLNQSDQVPGRKISKGVHYQRYGAISNKNLKSMNPVDVLLVGQTTSDTLDGKWIPTFGEGESGPKIIVYLHKGKTFLENNERFRAIEKRLKKAGYLSVTKLVSASACGSPTRGFHWFTFFFNNKHMQVPSDLVKGDLGDSKLAERGFQNCLVQDGLLEYRSRTRSGQTRRGRKAPAPAPTTDRDGGPKRSARDVLVVDPRGPAPIDVPFRIKNSKGLLRQLLPEEWAALKGYPKEYQFPPRLTKALIQNPGAHEWHWVGEFLTNVLGSGVLIPKDNPEEIGEPSKPVEEGWLDHPELGPCQEVEWTWEVPDLQKGGDFYKARMKRLREVTRECGGPQSWIEEGEKILDWHRTNYGPNGPTRLTVLWWEWPKEHWTALREGSSMNFMIDPKAGLVDNSDMEGDQKRTAIEFMDELISLGVLVPTTKEFLSNNFPLFLVDKPDRPGQYRCIADGKAGGQNDVCLGDPMHLLQPQDILPRLYPKGYSAVIDASKYFHMFKTKEDEWKYMGVQHPGTEEWFFYATLPMGTRASPGVACRFGAGFLREVVRTSEDFRGEPVINDFASDLQGTPLNPDLGLGRMDIGQDGVPACWLAIHIDDIFLHGPNLGKVTRALNHLLNTTVRLGLICQAAKTKPPRQWQKYCGFIYDTRGVPRMYTPINKYTRARSLVRYALDLEGAPLSRLALSTVAGVLQSLVPATPENIGNNYLVEIYKCIHEGMAPGDVGTRKGFFSPAQLTGGAKEELEWWFQVLGPGLFRRDQVLDTTVAGIQIGDGSGTGAGGTLNFHHHGENVKDTEAWMGTWVRKKALDESSNWKELRTLLEFLRREARGPGSRFRNRRIFYFTDNTTTYDVCRKGKSGTRGLHLMVREIKGLCATMNCLLTVLHIPGRETINQGSDDLSRGLWRYGGHLQENWKLPNLLKPVKMTGRWSLTWLLEKAGEKAPHPEELSSLPQELERWKVVGDSDPWDPQALFRSHVILLTSPSVTRQAMTAVVSAWCEDPLRGAAFVVVPRVVQRDFGRVNKHYHFLGQFDSHGTPFSHPLPFVVFFLPKYRRRLDDLDRGLDTPAQPRVPDWVSRQLDHMHRLQES